MKTKISDEGGAAVRASCWMYKRRKNVEQKEEREKNQRKKKSDMSDKQEIIAFYFFSFSKWDLIMTVNPSRFYSQNFNNINLKSRQAHLWDVSSSCCGELVDAIFEDICIGCCNQRSKICRVPIINHNQKQPLLL